MRKIEFTVAGTTFEGRQEILKDLGKEESFSISLVPYKTVYGKLCSYKQGGETVTDPYAIVVLAKSENYGLQEVGFVPKEIAKEIIVKEAAAITVVRKLLTGGTEEKPTRGLWVEIELDVDIDLDSFHERQDELGVAQSNAPTDKQLTFAEDIKNTLGLDVDISNFSKKELSEFIDEHIESMPKKQYGKPVVKPTPKQLEFATKIKDTLNLDVDLSKMDKSQISKFINEHASNMPKKKRYIKPEFRPTQKQLDFAKKIQAKVGTDVDLDNLDKAEISKFIKDNLDKYNN